MANIWEKAISILEGNFNLGSSYLITTVDVELQLAYNVINWSDAIKSKWIERLAIFFAVKENLHCSQYSANLFRLDFVEVVDIATVDPTIKSGPSIESLKKEAKPILNSYFYNLTCSICFIKNCLIKKFNWNVWKSLLFFGKLRNVDSVCLKYLIDKGW